MGVLSLFIKKLIINGFKSFAEKTIIEFQDGINVILGPNGCGKSNIIDAIRWVLGEQRLKTLRASKSEDLIFSGSETKPPSGFTEVGFILNNDPKIIHSDFLEVGIYRKIFRSGESAYQINKKDCRLKDITDLFVDTGLGKTSYSILQQGQIDQILSSRPEERRMIFEEAAGIARSKIIVKESQQKLFKTEENLIRLNDILLEVKKHAENLKDQAEAALNYRQLKNRTTQLEKGLYGIRYQGILRKINDAKEKKERYESQLGTIRIQMEELYSQSEDVRSQVALLEEKMEEFKNSQRDLEMEEYKINQNIQVLRNEHQRLKKAHSQFNQKQTDLSHRKKEIEESLNTRLNQEEDLENQIFEYEDNFTQLSGQFIELEENIQFMFMRIQALRNENKTLEQQLSEILKKQKEFFSNLITTLESQKENISLTLKEKNKVKEKLNQAFIYLEGFFKKWQPFCEQETIKTNHAQEVFLDLKNLSQFSSTFKTDFSYYDKLVQDILDFFEKDGNMVFDQDYNVHIQSIRTQIEINLDEITQKEEELENKRKSKDTVLRVQNETHIQLNRLKEKKLNLLTEQDLLTKEQNSLEEQLLVLSQEAQETQKEMEEVETEVFSFVDAYENIQNQKRQLENDNLQTNNQALTQTKRLKELETQQRNLSNEIERSSRGMDKFIIAYETSKAEKDMLEKSYTDRYGKEIHEIDFESIKDLTLALADEELSLCRQKIEEIGEVNLLAIDEYEEVKNRLHFLETEKTDLELAKHDLEKLIYDINYTSTQNFLKVFDQIQKNFQKIFIKAFNGGKCQLKLSDPDMPLESGIDIIAQPPGKKLQNITVLSGGERTMTALSIMFAIFMVKPSPFCLLDEVDAALDEANVERLINIIDDFVEKTQFIIITHNRITAQRGDIFYGVTMQEAGVTKVFSLKPENLEHQLS